MQYNLGRLYDLSSNTVTVRGSNTLLHSKVQNKQTNRKRRLAMTSGTTRTMSINRLLCLEQDRTCEASRTYLLRKKRHDRRIVKLRSTIVGVPRTGVRSPPHALHGSIQRFLHLPVQTCSATRRLRRPLPAVPVRRGASRDCESGGAGAGWGWMPIESPCPCVASGVSGSNCKQQAAQLTTTTRQVVWAGLGRRHDYEMAQVERWPAAL